MMQHTRAQQQLAGKRRPLATQPAGCAPHVRPPMRDPPPNGSHPQGTRWGSFTGRISPRGGALAIQTEWRDGLSSSWNTRRLD